MKKMFLVLALLWSTQASAGTTFFDGLKSLIFRLTGVTYYIPEYEQGTFTPVISPQSGAFGSVTYTLQVGSYTRIGRRVCWESRIAWSAATIGTGSGGLMINLPFSSSATYPQNAPFATAYSNIDFSTAAASAPSWCTGEYVNGSALGFAALCMRDDGTSGTTFFNEPATVATSGDFGKEMRFSGCYIM